MRKAKRFEALSAPSPKPTLPASTLGSGTAVSHDNRFDLVIFLERTDRVAVLELSVRGPFIALFCSPAFPGGGTTIAAKLGLFGHFSLWWRASREGFTLQPQNLQVPVRHGSRWERALSCATGARHLS